MRRATDGWWRKVSMSALREEGIGAFVEDSIAAGSEIESLHRVAARFGNGELPPDWKAPATKRSDNGM